MKYEETVLWGDRYGGEDLRDTSWRRDFRAPATRNRGGLRPELAMAGPFLYNGFKTVLKKTAYGMRIMKVMRKNAGENISG